MHTLIKHTAWFLSLLTFLQPSIEKYNSTNSNINCGVEVLNIGPLVVCEDEYDGKAYFNLALFTRSILDSLPNLEEVEPVILINQQTNGLLKVTNLESEGNSVSLCGPFSEEITDIAVNPQGQIFAVGHTNALYRLNESSCALTEVGNLGPLGGANSLSFDRAGNLYAGVFANRTVYRAESGQYESFSPWHTFAEGSPAGDFVMLGDKMYIAWTIDGEAGTSLFEVEVDDSFNYVSHIDLGKVRSNTFGLASELGSLYGIAFNELYEISVPDLTTRTVLNHPTPNVMIGSTDAWWGGAGLHEANYEVTYHKTEDDARNNQNQIEVSLFENEANPQTLHVRVYDRISNCERFGQFQLQVVETPKFKEGSSLNICLEDPLGGDYFLDNLNTDLVENTGGLRVSYFISEIEAYDNVNPITKVVTSKNSQVLFVRAEYTASGCFNVQSIDLKFQEKPALSIYGASSVCPEVSGVIYQANASIPVSNFRWQVFGGTIVEDLGSQIVVDWGETNSNASVSLSASYSLGCRPDSFILPIKINTKLEPSIPIGPKVICYPDRLGVIYSVPYVPGSEYKWFVENGNIVGQNNLNQVQVDWETNGIGSIYYEEFNPLISECKGTSETLTVETYPLAVVQTDVTRPSCIGYSNGTISLTFPDNSEETEVTWSNGATGTLVTGLSGGYYEYNIRGLNGCTYQGTVFVEDYPELVTTLSEKSNISCYGALNGYLMVGAEGGAGQYNFELKSNGREWHNRDGKFMSLPSGDFILRITDFNGCESELRTTITEPDLLEPDLSTLINEPICPGSSDGLISVLAKGGVEPYTYVWNGGENNESNILQGISKGEHVLRITDANACEIEFRVMKEEFYPKLSIPNAFSPNNDGFNDSFSVLVGCKLTNFSLKIFNKWGNIIFQTADSSKAWDGTYNGVDTPSGSYAYLVVYNNLINNEIVEQEIRGSFKLIR